MRSDNPTSFYSAVLVGFICAKLHFDHPGPNVGSDAAEHVKQSIRARVR
jgi:hypothetical protein